MAANNLEFDGGNVKLSNGVTLDIDGTTGNVTVDGIEVSSEEVEIATKELQHLEQLEQLILME